MNSLRLMQLYYAGEAQCVAWGQRLALPEFSEWQQAGQSAWNDTRQALASLGHFFFITFRPLCILLSVVSHAVSQWMWRYVLRPFYFQVLVPYSQLFYEKVLLVAYRNGLSQAKEYSIRFWQWQTTRTREELLMEAGVISSLVIVMIVMRWLQRQRYLTRITLWYQAQKRCAMAWYRKQKNKAIQVRPIDDPLLLLQLLCLVEPVVRNLQNHVGGGGRYGGSCHPSHTVWEMGSFWSKPESCWSTGLTGRARQDDDGLYVVFCRYRIVIFMGLTPSLFWPTSLSLSFMTTDSPPLRRVSGFGLHRTAPHRTAPHLPRFIFLFVCLFVYNRVTVNSLNAWLDCHKW